MPDRRIRRHVPDQTASQHHITSRSSIPHCGLCACTPGIAPKKNNQSYLRLWKQTCPNEVWFAREMCHQRHTSLRLTEPLALLGGHNTSAMQGRGGDGFCKRAMLGMPGIWHGFRAGSIAKAASLHLLGIDKGKNWLMHGVSYRAYMTHPLTMLNPVHKSRSLLRSWRSGRSQLASWSRPSPSQAGRKSCRGCAAERCWRHCKGERLQDTNNPPSATSVQPSNSWHAVMSLCVLLRSSVLAVQVSGFDDRRKSKCWTAAKMKFRSVCERWRSAANEIFMNSCRTVVR